MRILRSDERYTDRGHLVVTTRTTVLGHAQLTRIADHLRRNADDLALSTNPPTFENCRIAGAMLTWAFNIAPLRITQQYDY